MPVKVLRAAVLTAAWGVVSAPAFAYNNALLQVPTDPSGWGFASQIATLNAQTAGFNYQINSGYVFQIGPTIFDRTDVQTDVYRVTAAMSITTPQGPLALGVGDLVFAYRMTLVQSVPANTVSSLGEAQVIGAPDFGFGVNALDFSLVNGQGYVSPGPAHAPLSTNFDDAGPFGASIDFEWGGSDATNLDNNESVVMLMFTSPAGIGEGVLNLIAPPGQGGGLTGVAQANEAPPVLIPIVPGPGTAILGVFGLVGVISAGRRRAR